MTSRAVVDPAYRRHGVASALLRAALAQAHEHARVLLVVPRNAAGGDAFAKANNGRLNHSEHALVLRGAPQAVRRIDAVTLRRAVPGDARLVGDLIESGFGTRPEGVDERTFVVRYGDELIGTVTLSLRAGRARRPRPRTVAGMSSVPTAPLVAAGLVGGFAAARYTHRREVGGALFAAVGAWCARSWLRTSGPGTAGVLVGAYVAAMGGSHPLANRIGAWPSVAAVTAVSAGAAYVLADRRA